MHHGVGKPDNGKRLWGPWKELGLFEECKTMQETRGREGGGKGLEMKPRASL